MALSSREREEKGHVGSSMTSDFRQPATVTIDAQEGPREVSSASSEEWH